jgi:hypothetical protein
MASLAAVWILSEAALGYQIAAGLLGAYIDAKYLAPLLHTTKDPKFEGMRMADLKMSSASEGSPFPYVVGEKVKVPGIYLWVSPHWSEVPSENIDAGKGGGGSRPKYPPAERYYAHAAVGFARGRFITNFEELWGNGKVIWVRSYNINQSSYGVTMYTGTGDDVVFAHSIPDPDGMNFDLYKIGKDITVSGWTNANNNGTFKCTGKYNGGTVYYIILRNPNAVYESNPGTKNITLDQTISGWNSGVMTGLYSYKGSLDNTLNANDPIRDYYPASGNPVYSRRSFQSIKKLHLTEFANQLPKMEAVLSPQAASTTYATAISTMCISAGVSNVDVSGVSGTCGGYAVFGPGRFSQQLQPLLIAANVMTQQRRNTMYFFSRQNAENIALTTGELGAFVEGDKPAKDALFTQTEDKDLANIVEVKFHDKHNNYEFGHEPETAYGIEADNKKEVYLPITMSRAEAKSIARRLLWSARSATHTVRIPLPPDYYRILEGDTVTFTSLSNSWKILVLKRRRLPSGILEIEGVVQDDNTVNFSFADGESDRNVLPGLKGESEVDLMILDIGPLKDQHYETPGIYVAALQSGKDLHTFEGASLFSSDDDTEFFHKKDLMLSAQYGYCTAALGNTDAVPDQWDGVNTVTVYTHDPLESVTRAEVLNGANRFVIESSGGCEIIAATTASAQSSDLPFMYKYILSDLLRGLRDTEGEMGNHAVGDKVIYLNAPGVEFVPLNTRDLGVAKYYRLVPSGGSIDDYTSTTHTHELRSVKPFPPCHAKGSRDASDNITVTFDRKTRSLARLFHEGNHKPIVDSTEEYEIDIYGATWASVKRTISVDESKSTTYTAAQQTADGLIVGNSVKMRIYELSPIVGRGRYLEATL